MDDIDIKIINTLLANSRITIKDLSKDIDLSNVAIQSRINKLEEKGIVTGYTSKINYKQLGYSTIAFVGIFLEKAKYYREVIEQLNAVKNITEAHFTTGNYSIFAKIYAKNNDHLMEILNGEVQNIKGIARTETFISMEEGVLKPLMI